MERHIHKDKNKDKDGKDGKIVFFIFVKCQICSESVVVISQGEIRSTETGPG